MARMVQTRLWLGGEVSEQRDLPLSRRLTDTATSLGGRYDGWAANQAPPA